MNKARSIGREEVTVVVQGAVDPVCAAKCLSSVRKYLPGAEIVLSTWEGTNTSMLDYDEVVLNTDPGPSDLVRLYPFEHVNNINRQIVSTREGIRRASRKYVLKLRSDMLVKGQGFLKYYDVFGATVTKDAVFEKRILLNAKTSLFQIGAIGDWWQFGLRKDMLLLWDIPLYPDRRGEEYFLKPENAFKKPYGNETTCRFFPEIWIAYQCCRKFARVELEHGFDRASAQWGSMIRFLENNFLTIEPDFSDIVLPEAENRMLVKEPSRYLNYRRQVRLLRSTFGRVQIPLLRGLYWWGKYTYLKYKPRLKGFDYIYIVRNYAQPRDLEEIECAIISEEDVTFVVSGLVEEQARINLGRIRELFPQSKIILSIDTEQEISGLPRESYDELIQTPIVEEYHLDQFCHLNNTKRFTYNKQQVEVRNGLRAVKTRYAVRLRTDCYIEDMRLFSLYRQLSTLYSKAQKSFRLFKQKVLVCGWITGSVQKDPGYLSDCFAFGLTEDLLKLYNGRLRTLDDLHFFRKPENRTKKNYMKFSHRFTNEQFFYFSLLKEMNREFDEPESWCVWSTEQAMLFEKYLTNNFIVTSFRKLHIQFKNNYRSDRCLGRYFLEKYMTNVDPKNKKLDRELVKQQRELALEDCSSAIRHHSEQIHVSQKSVIKKLSEICTVGLYSVKFILQLIRLHLRED